MVGRLILASDLLMELCLGRGDEWHRQGHPRALTECALQVGDFGDAINWPTPGEIAHKSVQVSWRDGMSRMEFCLHVYIFGFSSFQSFRSYLTPKRSGWYNWGSSEIAKSHRLSPGCV